MTSYGPDDIELTTVGIDIGSSTSHLMFSRLLLARQGRTLSSRYEVVERRRLHASPITFTPYAAGYRIDVDSLRELIDGMYRAAGITADQVDTGAVILTGEAAKRTNARAIAELFAKQGGRFVCATAGPNLEAMLAAHGSGAVERSRATGGTVLNVDIGGGTSNLALIGEGQILGTSALSVGGRLVVVDGAGCIERLEQPARIAAESLGIDLRHGARLALADRDRLASLLVDVLFGELLGEPPTEATRALRITEPLHDLTTVDCVMFSGGVAEMVYGREAGTFGDLSWPMAEAINERIAAGLLPWSVCQAAERIRATVIGASQFAVQASGSTIGVPTAGVLPLRNLPVAVPRLPSAASATRASVAEAVGCAYRRLDLDAADQPVAVALDWDVEPEYGLLRALAEGVAQALDSHQSGTLPYVLVSRQDVGRTLGRILKIDMGVEAEVVSIDSVELRDFDYVDLGEAVGNDLVVPVVVKSLVFPTGAHPPAGELDSPSDGGGQG